MENPLESDQKQCIVERSQLQEKQAVIAIDVREVKQQLFRLTEHALQTERTIHLLN